MILVQTQLIIIFKVWLHSIWHNGIRYWRYILRTCILSMPGNHEVWKRSVQILPDFWNFKLWQYWWHSNIRSQILNQICYQMKETTQCSAWSWLGICRSHGNVSSTLDHKILNEIWDRENEKSTAHDCVPGICRSHGTFTMAILSWWFNITITAHISGSLLSFWKVGWIFFIASSSTWKLMHCTGQKDKFSPW